MYDARPYSIHQWRQTDCASFAKNYYEEGMHFFEPKIHWQDVKDGKTVSEFPIVNYSVACLYKVFGEHEYLYRFFILSLFFASMLFLFAVVYLFSESIWYSYFSILLLFTSPLLAYYSFNFLADVPALSFAIISLSLFFIFLKNQRLSLLYLAILFAILATLIKASAITVLFIIIGILLIQCLKFPKQLYSSSLILKRKTITLSILCISFLIIYLWYHYAFLYNNKNSNGVFLMETLPIWKMNDKVIETARLLVSVQLQMFFNKPILTAFSLVFTWLLFNLKFIHKSLQVSLIIASVSFGAFIILFFQVFNVHDYYLITSMIFPVVIIISFGDYLKNVSFDFYNKKTIALCFLITIGNIAYCASIIRLRNINQDTFCKYYPFITNDEKNFSDWFHYNYASTQKPLETITPYLRGLGIKRTDKVISIPDPSFNITLYLMDQKGYTLTEQKLKEDSLIIEQYTNLGAKYVVLSDTTILQKTILNTKLTNAVGTYKNIKIYKLK